MIIRGMPTVLTVPKEVPIKKEVRQQITKAARAKVEGMIGVRYFRQ
jgi:hypothetical protein